MSVRFEKAVILLHVGLFLFVEEFEEALGQHVVEFPHQRAVLHGLARDVQRQVFAIDHSFEEAQPFREKVLRLRLNEDLLALQIHLALCPRHREFLEARRRNEQQRTNRLLAEMPELGNRNRQQAAAPAGVAPHPQSGQWTGKAAIGGGRPAVRKALYMVALCASRLYPPLRDFYQRLRTAGKPGEVALTAVIRKLVILLNLLLKKPNLPLPA